MPFISSNPATGETLEIFAPMSESAAWRAVEEAHAAWLDWSSQALDQRIEYVRRLGRMLRERREACARLLSIEVGKLWHESLDEVDKCVRVCDYYAQHAPAFLARERNAGSAQAAYVDYLPLGPLLAIMPWNYPLWQFFRFAAANLVAGNTILVKPAANVPRCAQAIQDLVESVGLPCGVVQTLLLEEPVAEALIAHPRLRGITLTGSVGAGRAVAAAAGRHLKKSVLELGGSDPFVVLDDADLAAAVAGADHSRFKNAGQSCDAAKRCIVDRRVLVSFTDLFVQRLATRVQGDPLDERTTLAPLATSDVLDTLEAQVADAVGQGARCIQGPRARACCGGWFYPATILTGVHRGMRIYREEVFGPVAVILEADNEEHALHLANDTEFGLGGSVWTADTRRGERFALQMECGMAAVNKPLSSHPHLPFGGIKASGYGRELAREGIHAFVNVKTIGGV